MLAIRRIFINCHVSSIMPGSRRALSAEASKKPSGRIFDSVSDECSIPRAGLWSELQ